VSVTIGMIPASNVAGTGSTGAGVVEVAADVVGGGGVVVGAPVVDVVAVVGGVSLGSATGSLEPVQAAEMSATASAAIRVLVIDTARSVRTRVR
jgi:hypothetical protein